MGEIIVQKFGGTSVGNTERIKRVAKIVAKEAQHNTVIVVVSAMAGTTDKLIGHTVSVSTLKDSSSIAEYDTIIASGEQVAAGLLALSLQSLGLQARSFMGWQLPIHTDGVYANARITAVKTKYILDACNVGIIPIIAGFQGVYNNRIVTLGRGGSDTTASAVAAAVNASSCDIYTDVTGIFTADPRIVPEARKLDTISYQHMLAIAMAGAKVVHPRAVEIALKNNTKMRILSSFEDEYGNGTTLTKNGYMEERTVISIVGDSNIVGIWLSNIKSTEALGELLVHLTGMGINIEATIESIDTNGSTVKLIVPVSDAQRVINIISNANLHHKILINDKIARITIVGGMMCDGIDLLQKAFQILVSIGISIAGIVSSGSSVSVLLESRNKRHAMQALHSGFGLTSCQL